jgi:chromosome segregation ATPase
VIGGLALGGVTLLVGPERVAATIASARGKIQDTISTCSDDPDAIRRQLSKLAEDYPNRIAEVEGELAEVDFQIEQLERDVQLSQDAIAIATNDVEVLGALVKKAESEMRLVADREVYIRFDGVRWDLDEAYDEGRRINQARTVFQDRIAQDEMQIEFLKEQQKRLAEIHAKLNDEFGSYQARLWQLDRQIDAIERNDRLIELTKEQQATLASYTRFGTAHNMKQIEGKLREMKAAQEAQLRQLAKLGLQRDYEERARARLDQPATASDDPFGAVEVEIGGDGNQPLAPRSASTSGPVAFAQPPLVIEPEPN